MGMSQVPPAEGLKGELELSINDASSISDIVEAQHPIMKFLEGFRIQFTGSGDQNAIRNCF